MYHRISNAVRRNLVSAHVPSHFKRSKKKSGFCDVPSHFSWSLRQKHRLFFSCYSNQECTTCFYFNNIYITTKQYTRCTVQIQKQYNFFPKALCCWALVIGPIPGIEWYWSDNCRPQETRIRVGSVGIGTMLLDVTLRIQGSIAGKVFFLLRNVQTVSRAYPVCCSVGTDALSLCVKSWPEREHSSTCYAEVMNMWSFTSTLMWRLYGVGGDNFTNYTECQFVGVQTVAAYNNRKNVHINIRLKRVRVTTIAIEKRCYLFWVCVCSLSYPACNAHSPYCRLWPAWLYSIFPHYLKKGTIFGGGGELRKVKCLLIFSTTFVWNISHCKKDWARFDMYLGLHVRYPLFLQDF